jgi:hypothetical protein
VKVIAKCVSVCGRKETGKILVTEIHTQKCTYIDYKHERSLSLFGLCCASVIANKKTKTMRTRKRKKSLLILCKGLNIGAFNGTLRNGVIAVC